MLLIVLVLILVLVSRGNAQEAKKNPFEMPKQHASQGFKLGALPVLGKVGRSFAEHHGKISGVIGHVASRVDIADFSIGNNGHVVPGSPILTQSLNWRKK
jgi:hypothetical protein